MFVDSEHRRFFIFGDRERTETTARKRIGVSNNVRQSGKVWKRTRRRDLRVTIRLHDSARQESRD